MKSQSRPDQARMERLQAELQAEINSTTFSPRVEAERRQSVFRKNEAEKAKLKDIINKGFLYQGNYSKPIDF